VIHEANTSSSQMEPVSKVVECRYDGTCGDCRLPFTLGHPIIKRKVQHLEGSSWCHLVCQLEGTPPRPVVRPSGPLTMPLAPPTELMMQAAAPYEERMIWINLFFVDVVGDWMMPEAKLSSHRLCAVLVNHYSTAVVWECGGDHLTLSGSTAFDLQLQLLVEGSGTVDANRSGRSLAVYGASAASDGLWVRDFAALHGSDEWIAHRVCQENPRPEGAEFSLPVASRRQMWNEKYEMGGTRMSECLRCWSSNDCGGRLSNVVGEFSCPMPGCKASAHAKCMGVGAPIDGHTEVVCPKCRASQATDYPSDDFMEQMGQVTLVEVGSATDNATKKAKRAVKAAMLRYTNKYNLNPESPLMIRDVGVAFLREVGSEGKVSQMGVHRRAISKWLVERELPDWTNEELAREATREPKKAMTKAPSPSDAVSRDIIKHTHMSIVRRIGDGSMHPLIGTRTNFGQHGALGGGARAGELAGTDISHGPKCNELLLSDKDIIVWTTPHAMGTVPGDLCGIAVPYSVMCHEDDKTSLEESRTIIAGETFRRRVEELASAWGRKWKHGVEVPGKPGVKFRHMDYMVLRVSLQGVVLGTPRGDTFLEALMLVQSSHNHDPAMRTQTMMKWLRSVVKDKTEGADLEQKWVNVMGGTEAELSNHGPCYMSQLQGMYDMGLRNLFSSSGGTHGSKEGGAKIHMAIRSGPVLCSTTGGGKVRHSTPMPLTVTSLEKDIASEWAAACVEMGIPNSKPTTHGGRREACNLARSFAAQANISPTDLRERVNHFFRWTPENDRMQIYYSGHLDWSEQLKMTVMFWMAGGEYDY
jgi:hypothetical protein